MSPAETVRNGSEKTLRHRTIVELVRKGTIRTQEELVTALRRHRLRVTQATVSRDIRELGLVRVHDGQGLHYVLAAAEHDEGGAETRLRTAMRSHVLSLEFADLLGVVKAQPSTAPLVASAIDGARFDEVAGTVAGDDTVLIVARSRPAAQRLLSLLKRLMGEER